MIAGLQQRCWNHEYREAVCRCLECGRSFCRECVTEHKQRLLCAACLAVAMRAGAQKRNPWRRVAPAAMTVAGLLIAWMVLFGAAESLLILAQRAERPANSTPSSRVQP